MSFQAKRELLAQIGPRYREASHAQRSVILNEFVAATGYARKYAIRLLAQPLPPALSPIKRPRARHYGKAVQDALLSAWAAANYICAKRLVPFLPDLVAALERHGHLTLSDEVRTQLLAISSATADRILRMHRQDGQPRGISTTKPGKLLKKQIPVRTFTDWNEGVPGFVEADLVAHCGWGADGAYLYTLVLTDVASGWTECLPLLHRSQSAVIQAIDRARQLLPFPLLGIDTDNGSEFLNAELLAYCQREQITFTRGRAYRKNDQCFVEQKNGVIVRQLVGYDRFSGELAYRQLTELYRAVRLYVNFFQPSMKLVKKRREGAKVERTYDTAQTPLKRLLATEHLTPAGRQHLNELALLLDPVRLLQQLEMLQDALWKHALLRTASAEQTVVEHSAPMHRRHMHFEVDACGLGEEMPTAGNGKGLEPRATSERAKRAYRRTKKQQGPRLYRTRLDPFASVWSEVCSWLTAQPERTGQSIFLELQQRYPGQFSDGQLRTLQRRVAEWRAKAILAFDDQWLQDEVLGNQALPRPLRVVSEEQTAQGMVEQELVTVN